MATIAYNGSGAGKSVVRAQTGRTTTINHGTFSFDSSYPTGGEDISDIFNQHTECFFVIMEQPIQAGAQTGKFLKVDHTNKKVQLFTNAAPFAEIANASDQSLITGLKWVSVGF